jgi:heme/copper-type cytochrome/quinol oxidase subunit 2
MLLLSYAFQDPATPLMEGIIALHSDIMGYYAIALCYYNLYFSATTEYTYKVHHNSFIEIVWTPSIILCIIQLT